MCFTSCIGDEHRLIECVLTTDCGSDICSHSEDVGVTCSKSMMTSSLHHMFIIIPTANSWTTGTIVGITLGAFFCVVFIVGMITLCICCLHPKCSCYYRKRRSYVVLVSQPQEVYTVTANQQQFPPPYSYQTIPPSATQ